MVKIITKSLWRGMLGYCAFVALCLTSLQLVFNVLSESGSLRRDYGFLESLTYSLVVAGPGSLVFILPIVMLIGTLLVLGHMADNSELVVMRCSGMSRLGIFARLLPITLLIAIGVMLLEDSLFLPLRNQAADTRNRLRQTESSESGSLALKLGQQFMVAESIDTAGRLKHVHVFTFDDDFRLSRQARAATGQASDYQIRLDRPLVSAYGGMDEQVHNVRTDDLLLKTSHSLDFLRWLSLSKFSDTTRLSFAELWEFAGYQQQLNPHNNQFLQVFYNKLVLPINILAFMLLVLPFVFGSSRAVNTSTKVIVAIMIGLVFVNIQQITLPLHVIFGLPPLLVAALPALLTLSIATGLIMWQRN